MILYFADVDECGGPTHFVPRAGPDDPAYQWPYTKMPGTGVHRFINDRATAERYLEQSDPELSEFRAGKYTTNPQYNSIPREGVD